MRPFQDKMYQPSIAKRLYSASGLRNLRWAITRFFYARYCYAINRWEYYLSIPQHWTLIHSLIGYFKGTHCYPTKIISISDPAVTHHWESLAKGYDHETLIKRWIQRISKQTMVSYDGLMSLANCVEYLQKHRIPGSFVETGTWNGGSLALMAIATEYWVNLNHPSTVRPLYGFDSFEGIPQPDPNKDNLAWITQEMKLDPSQCEGKLIAVGALESSYEAATSLLSQLDLPNTKVSLHKGWFQETLPAMKEKMGPIALLRLDGDLYDSTKCVLDELGSHVVPGGIIIIDDWCLQGARTATEEYLTNKYGSTPPIVHRVDGNVAYFQVPIEKRA